MNYNIIWWKLVRKVSESGHNSSSIDELLLHTLPSLLLHLGHSAQLLYQIRELRQAETVGSQEDA